MSYQKHNHRSEIWLVIRGSCKVNYANDNPESKKTVVLNKFDKFIVEKGHWTNSGGHGFREMLEKQDIGGKTL